MFTRTGIQGITAKVVVVVDVERCVFLGYYN